MLKLNKKRKIRLFISLFIVVVIIIGAITVDHLINTSPSGVIHQSSSQSGQAAAAAFNLNPTDFTGSYSSFQYPKGLVKLASNNIVDPVVADYNFEDNINHSWYVDISVFSIAGGNLESNNAYQTRETNPTIYKESYITSGSTKVIVMTDTSAPNYDKVAFLVNSKYQATIAVNGIDLNSSTDMDNTLSMIVKSWKWDN